MIPARFEYEVAGSVEEAIELLGRHEDAKLLAGGHSLLPLMKLRFARPEALVDLGRVEELRYVREDGDRIEIGALVRHHDLERDETVREHCAVLAHAAGTVGDPQVRHRGTIGGSLAHADPAGDLPAVCLTLDAELVVRGPEGERTHPASEFFQGPFMTPLGPQDVLCAVRVPKVGGAGWSFQKFVRRAQDWAMVGVVAVAADGGARVGLVNMGATPLRARAVEEALAGGADPAAAAEAAAEGADPPSDATASAEYRRHLARVLVRRGLEEAL